MAQLRLILLKVLPNPLKYLSNLYHKGPCFGVSYERMWDTLWFTKWLLILLSDISYQQLSYALQTLGKKVIEIDYT